MSWNDTLQNLLLVGSGAVAIELIRYLKDFTSGLLNRRRTEVDRMARELTLVTAERDKQTIIKYKLRELVYTLRVMMIQSGKWSQEDLPDIPDEGKE